MAKIEINGQELEAHDGAMVIEIADEAGIPVPRFCYHSKLSLAASCRMCLVEVENAPKPMPACATPVADGMKVFTRSPKAISAQRAVMEFLLINHPLDCPICDQGGECDLQEVAMGYGQDVSHYHESKRVVADKDIGPLIATDMTRCIQCTRCVRFGQEIAGVMELGAPGRGEHMHIETFVENSVDSELSGNVIDLCPVGALTSKPYRFSARPWELTAIDSVSPHDCVGSNTTTHVRRNQVMRVISRGNDEINESWIADRDRFSYTALNHDERLTVPMIKRDGKWQESDWDTALTFAAEGLKKIAAQDANQIGALASYNATNEEYYLLQKVMRGLGSNNIDHRLRQLDLSGQESADMFPYLGQSVAELSEQNAILLVGSNIRKEQPLLGHRVRKASRNGASIMVVNPIDHEFNFPVTEKRIASPAAMVNELAAVASALLDITGEQAPSGLDKLLAGCAVETTHKNIATTLKEAEQASVLIGNGAAYHPQQAQLSQLAALIGRLAKAKFGVIAEGGNSVGAWLAGCVPHRQVGGEAATIVGMDWRAMFNGELSGYLVLGTEPEVDCIDSAAAQNALQEAEFVVSMNSYVTDAMKKYADVLLPVAQAQETSGSTVNTAGDWQTFTAAVVAPGEARPAWKILRVMGNLFDIAGFEFVSSEEISDELQAACEGKEASADIAWSAPGDVARQNGLMRISDFPIYTVDPMVRRAEPLQQSADASQTAIRISAATLSKAGLSGASEARLVQGDEGRILPLVEDDSIAEGCVYVACGVAETIGLGAGFAPVQLEKV